MKVSNLPKDYKEDVETIAILSDDYSSNDKDAHALDDALVAKLKSEGLDKVEEKKKPTEKKPAEKKKTISKNGCRHFLKIFSFF